MTPGNDSLAKLQKLKSTAETWELSVRKARTWIEEKGEIYRPYMLLLVNERALVVGSHLFDHYPSADEVWPELARQMRRPMLGAGSARRPQNLHTDQAELADALRPVLEQAGIRVDLAARLPALEDAYQVFTKALTREDPQAFGIWKTPGVTEPLARRLYELAAEFYRLAPWKRMTEEFAVEVRYPPEAEARFAVVIGVMGDELGLSINDHLEELGQMWNEPSPKKYAPKFSWLTLSYETPDYLPFDDLDAGERYGWALPAPNTVPWIVRMGTKETFGQASLQDLFWLEGALAALNQYFARDFHPQVDGLPRDEQRAYTVETLNGKSSAVIRTPVWPEGFLPEIPPPVLTPKEREKAEKALEKAQNQLKKKNWKGAARTCLALLKWLPQDEELQEAAWAYLGNAYALLKDFDACYLAYSKALEYAPDKAYLWYNRGSAALFTFRSGQAQRDLQKAVKLEEDKQDRQMYQKALDRARKVVKDDLRTRGRGFKLDQLIEHQELFNRGVQHLAAKRWDEAEQTFRQMIAMADVLPQPNGNLGVVLMIKQRYDEAEAALRRALEIDPDYQLAQGNLATLQHARQTGRLPRLEANSLFEDADLDISLVFRE